MLRSPRDDSAYAELEPRAAAPRCRSRSSFAPTSDVHSAEHLQRLLATIDALQEHGGENVQKVRGWLAAQSEQVQSWFRQKQPLHCRRLDATHAVMRLLQGEGAYAGALIAALDELRRLDDGALLVAIPQLCDALVQQTAGLGGDARAELRTFLLAYSAASQHAALHIGW